MSYPNFDTGNSMNNYFTRLIDFVLLSQHLIKAETPHAFEIWIEKLELIDKRSLYLFLKDHKDEIPKIHLKIAQWRFKKII